MSELSLGAPAPDFTLPATGGREESPGAHRGQKIVLFFYPKDNTAG